MLELETSSSLAGSILENVKKGGKVGGARWHENDVHETRTARDRQAGLDNLSRRQTCTINAKYNGASAENGDEHREDLKVVVSIALQGPLRRPLDAPSPQLPQLEPCQQRRGCPWPSPSGLPSSVIKDRLGRQKEGGLPRARALTNRH